MPSSFHPQPDGQSELTYRTLEDMLPSFNSPRQSDRDEHLTAVEFAIDNSCLGTGWCVSVSQPPAEVCLTDLAWDYPGV